jgi:hypothetical protein
MFRSAGPRDLYSSNRKREVVCFYVLVFSTALYLLHNSMDDSLCRTYPVASFFTLCAIVLGKKIKLYAGIPFGKYSPAGFGAKSWGGNRR